MVGMEFLCLAGAGRHGYRSRGGYDSASLPFRLGGGGGKPRLTNIMPCLTNSMLHLSFTENYKGFLALKDLRVKRETESSAGMKTAASPLENDEFYVHLELETITKTQEIIPKNAPNVSISLSLYIYLYT